MKRAPAPPPTALIGALSGAYPELAAFTAGATLTEIKLIYGLASFEDVRALGRARLTLRAQQRQARGAAVWAPGARGETRSGGAGRSS